MQVRGRAEPVALGLRGVGVEQFGGGGALLRRHAVRDVRAVLAPSSRRPVGWRPTETVVVKSSRRSRSASALTSTQNARVPSVVTGSRAMSTWRRCAWPATSSIPSSKNTATTSPEAKWASTSGEVKRVRVGEHQRRLALGLAGEEEGGRRRDGGERRRPVDPRPVEPDCPAPARGPELGAEVRQDAEAEPQAQKVRVNRNTRKPRNLAIPGLSVVRGGGLEPPRCYPLAPQASASANSAILALGNGLIAQHGVGVNNFRVERVLVGESAREIAYAPIFTGRGMSARVERQTETAMSGHSRWSTIKHKKAASDAKKGKAWTKVIKEITVAARMGGGDINGNPRLRKAVDAARAENMPMDNISKAIKRGTGELDGISYDEVTYEGTGPSGTLILVDALTDNRNRTVAELRKIFEKNGGTMGSANTASWAFDRKGHVRMAKTAATEEQLFDIALGAGAEDISLEEEEWLIVTPPAEVDVVRNALEAAKLSVKLAELAMVPKSLIEVSGRDAEVLLRLVEVLDDHDDVQHVWANFDVSDEEMARIDGE